MQDNGRKLQLDQKALNLDYSFNWDVDLSNRVIRLCGDIESDDFGIFDAQLTALEEISRKPVTVRISTFGGDVYAALAIAGRMKASKCKTIVTEVYGKCMSAGTLICVAGKYRKMSSLSYFMHHEAYYGMEGRHSEMKATLKQAEREENDWCSAMESFTGIPANYWKNEGVSFDKYFSAEECLQLGIVDEIV